jgi:nicotinate phosphoribosyltransferase family protein
MGATAHSSARALRPAVPVPDTNGPGLLTSAQTSPLTDQYELATASSSLARGMNGPAVFELFVRHLPPKRWRLLGAGLGPAVSMVGAMESGGEELAYVRSLGFGRPFLDYLARFRFSGRVDAVPGDRASSCWSRSCAADSCCAGRRSS